MPQNLIIEIPQLATWHPFCTATEATLKNHLQGDVQLLAVDHYGKMQGLSRLYAPTIDPAFYYLKDGQVAIIVIEDASTMASLSEQEFIARLGESQDAQLLASPIDKQATLFAYPEHGITFTIWDDAVVAVELFSARSLEAYLKEIYEKPGPRPL